MRACSIRAIFNKLVHATFSRSFEPTRVLRGCLIFKIFIKRELGKLAWRNKRRMKAIIATPGISSYERLERSCSSFNQFLVGLNDAFHEGLNIDKIREELQFSKMYGVGNINIIAHFEIETT